MKHAAANLVATLGLLGCCPEAEPPEDVCLLLYDLVNGPFRCEGVPPESLDRCRAGIGNYRDETVQALIACISAPCDMRLHCVNDAVAKLRPRKVDMDFRSACGTASAMCPAISCPRFDTARYTEDYAEETIRCLGAPDCAAALGCLESQLRSAS